MAGWNHGSANWKQKECLICKNLFTPKSGAHKFCSPVCKGKWKYVSGSVTTESQYESISGNWERYLSRLMYFGGRKRDKLSKEILLKKLVEQNYKCALSGISLTCLLEKGKKHPFNVSVDRIIPGGPYTEENIQLVCRALNSWRADTDLEVFILMCKSVANYHKADEDCEVQDGYET
jgi:hypothetical protein